MDELRQQLGTLHQNTMAQLNYAKTMILLRALKAGTVKLDQVILDGDNWTVTELPADAAIEAAATGE